MIAQIKLFLKELGFVLQPDGKTYIRETASGKERIYWCTSCGSSFAYSNNGKQLKSISGTAYNLIRDHISSLN